MSRVFTCRSFAAVLVLASLSKPWPPTPCRAIASAVCRHANLVATMIFTSALLRNVAGAVAILLSMVAKKLHVTQPEKSLLAAEMQIAQCEQHTEH